MDGFCLGMDFVKGELKYLVVCLVEACLDMDGHHWGMVFPRAE